MESIDLLAVGNVRAPKRWCQRPHVSSAISLMRLIPLLLLLGACNAFAGEAGPTSGANVVILASLP
ncbi:MAG: hypothetical protein WCH43_05390, partial [Verrucomicrobiota bacterium]